MGELLVDSKLRCSLPLARSETIITALDGITMPKQAAARLHCRSALTSHSSMPLAIQ